VKLLTLKILLRINWLLANIVHKLLEKLDSEGYQKTVEYSLKLSKASKHEHVFISETKKENGRRKTQTIKRPTRRKN
jgi:hypothetical protein